MKFLVARSLATIASLGFSSLHGATTQAFVAPPPPAVARHVAGSAAPSSSAISPLQGKTGVCLEVDGLSKWYCRSTAQAHRRNQHGRGQQLTRMAASSRVNGADVSQDLSQLNGAEAAPPIGNPAVQSRVRLTLLCLLVHLISAPRVDARCSLVQEPYQP